MTAKTVDITEVFSQSLCHTRIYHFGSFVLMDQKKAEQRALVVRDTGSDDFGCCAYWNSTC